MPQIDTHLAAAHEAGDDQGVVIADSHHAIECEFGRIVLAI